jgi:hypothetical protein
VLVSGPSSSPVLPRVRALLNYVRTTAAGDCCTPRSCCESSSMMASAPLWPRRRWVQCERVRRPAPVPGPSLDGHIGLLQQTLAVEHARVHDEKAGVRSGLSLGRGTHECDQRARSEHHRTRHRTAHKGPPLSPSYLPAPGRRPMLTVSPTSMVMPSSPNSSGPA